MIDLDEIESSLAAATSEALAEAREGSFCVECESVVHVEFPDEWPDDGLCNDCIVKRWDALAPFAAALLAEVRQWRALGPHAMRTSRELDEVLAEVERLRAALVEASYRLHEYRKVCGCLSMSGICPRCTKTLQIEDNATAALETP